MWWLLLLACGGAGSNVPASSAQEVEVELPGDLSPLTLAGMVPQAVEWAGEVEVVHHDFVVVLKPRPASLEGVQVRTNPAKGIDFSLGKRWVYTTTRPHKGAGDEKPRWARVAGDTKVTSRWARGGVGLHSTCNDPSDEGLAWCSDVLRQLEVRPNEAD